MLKTAYLEWIKDYTNNDFIVDGVEKVPAMIDLIIDEMIEHDEKSNKVSSESLGDYSVTFEWSDLGYSNEIMARLQPYVRRPVTFV